VDVEPLGEEIERATASWPSISSCTMRSALGTPSLSLIVASFAYCA
jgi:hypothetical protein